MKKVFALLTAIATVSTRTIPSFVLFNKEFIEKMKEAIIIDPVAARIFLSEFLKNFFGRHVPQEHKEMMESNGGRFDLYSYINRVICAMLDEIIPMFPASEQLALAYDVRNFVNRLDVKGNARKRAEDLVEKLQKERQSKAETKPNTIASNVRVIEMKKEKTSPSINPTATVTGTNS